MTLIAIYVNSVSIQMWIVFVWVSPVPWHTVMQSTFRLLFLDRKPFFLSRLRAVWSGNCWFRRRKQQSTWHRWLYSNHRYYPWWYIKSRDVKRRTLNHRWITNPRLRNFGDQPLFPDFPKDRSDHESGRQGEEVSDKVIIGISPVTPPHFPYTRLELSPWRLRISCREMKIRSSRRRCR